ncbi:MAG TPA: helix-turn-helix domain-containing protein [Acidimicrobiales bacterium]|nr:helix-turn-helix domain-containing protein [Acidimicrobiales bacterium]
MKTSASDAPGSAGLDPAPGSIDPGDDEAVSLRGAGRNLRADARRNRARVLEAAEAVFGSEGLAVPIDIIAERAGVGVGTIYRHFPTKEVLFEAIVLSHFERLVDDARCLVKADDPAEALFGYLARLVDLAFAKRDLADALAGAGIDVKATASGVKHQLEAAIGELLVRAQRAGAVRADVTVADLMGFVTGACMATDRQIGDPGSPRRMLDIVCDGLRQPSHAAQRRGA